MVNFLFYDKNKKVFFRRLKTHTGRGREDRTPISGFGDRYTTIVLYPYGAGDENRTHVVSLEG